MTENFQIIIGAAQLVGERSTNQQNDKARAVLLLHAGVADRRMWRAQLAALESDFAVIAYDRRGFGETTTADEAFSHVEDLRELLDQFGVTTVTLIGCSQGGRVAIDFALAYPQRVTALILIASAISGAPAPALFPADIQARMDTLDEADDAEDLALINAIEANLWLDGPTSPDGRVGGTLRALFLDMNGIALQMPELTQEIEPPSAYERLPTLSLPTLVMVGELDFPHVKERCRYLVDALPAARKKELPGTAHLPMLEQPEAVNVLIRDFLSVILHTGRF